MTLAIPFFHWRSAGNSGNRTGSARLAACQPSWRYDFAYLFISGTSTAHTGSGQVLETFPTYRLHKYVTLDTIYTETRLPFALWLETACNDEQSNKLS